MTAASTPTPSGRQYELVATIAFVLAGTLALGALSAVGVAAAHTRDQAVAEAVRQHVDDSGFAIAHRYRHFATLAGFLVLFFWPPLVLGSLYVWCDGKRERLRQVLPLLAAGGAPFLAMLTLAASTVLHYQGRGWFYATADTSVGMARERYDWALESLGMPKGAWLATLVAVALGSLAGLVALNTVPKATFSCRAQQLVAALTLALGIAAFVATRAHAADAAIPLPLWAPEYTVALAAPKLAELPRDCIPLDDAMLIRVDAGGSIQAWGTEHAHRDQLRETLKRQRELWGKLHPSATPPRRVLLDVSVARPAAELSALVRTTREVGYDEFYAVRSLPTRVWQTRTLGLMPYKERSCGVRFDPESL